MTTYQDIPNPWTRRGEANERYTNAVNMLHHYKGLLVTVTEERFVRTLVENMENETLKAIMWGSRHP